MEMQLNNSSQQKKINGFVWVAPIATSNALSVQTTSKANMNMFYVTIAILLSIVAEI